ncbi:MAG: LiaI-LiaF-like domain-containing protein [Methanomassiliicoccales archaeon]
MRRVGSITSGIGLIALGIFLVGQIIFPLDPNFYNPLRWWPLLLMGTGIEILIYYYRSNGQRIRLDPVLILFLLAIWLNSVYQQLQRQIPF